MHLQIGIVAGFGNWAWRKAGLFFLGRDDPLDPVRRIQPGFAQAVEFKRGLGDGLGDRQARRVGEIRLDWYLLLEPSPLGDPGR